VTLRVPTLVVIGGGAIGVLYVRQLRRAIAAGRLEAERIVVVDRDPRCAAAVTDDPRVRLDAEEWDGWLDRHLESLGPADHLVPYHWAPHLLVGWLARALARDGARAARHGGIPPLGLPFERATAAGDRALSYATWICPPTCIEPALCPHTRGPKDWSLAGLLEERGAEGRPDRPFDGAVVFRSLHLVYGVASIPVKDILAARARLAAEAGNTPRQYLVATSSHCHALATVLTVTREAGHAAESGLEVTTLT
jgi:hypothetical protein